MTSYSVSYDLVGTHESSDDYARLIKRIKSYPWWGKIQKSAWIVRSPMTAAQIRDHLAAVMDSDDRLFVGKLTGEAAWRHVICDAEALKGNL